tara:strand:+ start:2321 stop:3214 length:894 start_codon:yes stop_codon:yes gene_type:complete
MFNNYFFDIYNSVYPSIEGLCLPSCKGKKVGKKAKKKSRKIQKEFEADFSNEASLINDSIESGEKNGGTSICNPKNLPSNVDIKLLNDVIDITEKVQNNVDEKKNIDNLFDDYSKSVNFNLNYFDNLIDKENNFFGYAFGNNNYSNLYNKRLLDINTKNSFDVFNDDINNLIDNINKSIYINSEIIQNKTALEENKESLKKQKTKLINNINNINNGILVDNRDSHYENLNNSFILNLIQIIIYTYIIFYILYFFQTIKNPNFSIYNDSIWLLILALLPTFIFDNFMHFIYFIQKNFF